MVWLLQRFRIAIGFFAFLLTGAFISECLHATNAGVFPGLVAAIWTARPFLHKAHIERQNLLHPLPRQYQVPAKIAFAKIRDLLADTSYNFGDRWHVATADTQTGRISASLRFTDEHTHWEPDRRGHIHTRKERVQRFVGLDIRIQEAGDGNTFIQLDFSPKAEGANLFACDAIITDLTNSMAAALGPSTQTITAPLKSLPPSPWWLLAITILALLSLLGGTS